MTDKEKLKRDQNAVAAALVRVLTPEFCAGIGVVAFRISVLMELPGM